MVGLAVVFVRSIFTSVCAHVIDGPIINASKTNNFAFIISVYNDKKSIRV